MHDEEMRQLLVLQHIEREGPGLFCQVAEKRGLKVRVFRLDLGESLPDLIEGDLLLVLGGPMGIRDINNPIYPWLLKEVEFIRNALRQKVGIIGVCLGAQLLAYAAGGNVQILKEGSPPQPLAEIGWSPISSNRINKNDDLISFLNLPLTVLHWHGDRILLPTTAELIASSSRCKEQLFKIGPLAYGLQFHIEIDEGMVNSWIEEDIEFITATLGLDGPSILKQQQLDYGYKSHESRLKLLNKLFDNLGA